MLIPFACAMAASLGCGEEEEETSTSGDETNDGMAVPPTFAVDIEPLLTSTCAPMCHEIDGLNETLILSEGEAYDNIVDVMSGQLPQMSIVNPGDKSTSYMWHKLNNTHLAEGGSGAQMPYSDETIPAAQLIVIGNWIDDGAMP